MSSSTTTISSTHSTMNNNDRKRPISSSIRPSPSPPSAKRRGLSSSISRKSTKNTTHRTERNEIIFKKSTDQNERQSRSKQQYRHIDNKSSSSDSSRSSSNSNHSINQEYSTSTLRTIHDSHKSTIDIKRDNGSNENTSTKKTHLNSMNNSNRKSDIQTDTIYTKKVAFIVQPTTTTTIDQRNLLNIYDSDEEFERTKRTSEKILTKSTRVVVPSTVMTIVTTPDVSKKSMRTDTNVIIQQVDGNLNPKLVKLVVPQSTNSSSSSSIKMLSSGDGLASALRVPAKIQLTKTLLSSSLTENDKTSSLISSTSTHSINQEHLTSLFDIPIDMTEKQQQQQSVPDYHSSTTLPPTPPPPVIDNTNANGRNVLSHSSNKITQQEKINDASTMNIKETVSSTTINEHSNDQTMSKRHSLHIDHPSSLSDWSVPPTSELSPTSLTSSSPDLSQNHLPPDDSLVELDSKRNSKRSLSSTKRRYRSLSSSCPILPSFTMCCLQSNDSLIQPIKSKSLTRLSNSLNTKFMLINNKRSITSSPILQLSSVQRLKKRRRDNENFILHQYNGKIYKSKTKQIKFEDDDHSIVKDLLNEIIERIVSTNGEKDNALKTLLITPIPQFKHGLLVDSIPNRGTTSNSMKTEVLPRTTTSTGKKSRSSSQSLDLTIQNESRSMTMTSRELDELAYLLHANVHRGEFERIGNPAKVEERMREMWSQMSNQKKNSYYKRVIQIYKRPNRDVVIASSSSMIENNTLSSNDSCDNTNPLSIELKRQTSTPLSFHSIPSSTTDDQSIVSPEESNFKTNIFADIVNELIKGAKGLDKLSCSPTAFTNSIHNFVRSTIDKQTQIIKNLERQVEKKCSQQLVRATIFWREKINYFANKHSINSTNESMNELTLIVKYFYLLVLSLNCRKQEAESEAILTDLLNGKLIFNESFCSPILTSIIEDLILRSSLANDYLASQPMIINQIEYSLPFIRHTELEYDLLNKNETLLTGNPFSDLNDLEDYLNRCEHMTTTTTTIPCYPMQQSHHPSMYYPPYHHPPEYYYSPPPTQSSDMNNYYYNPTTSYSNSQQMYSYSHPTSYYRPSTTYNNNEQLKYYYNQQQSSYSYPSQPNSTNDIPLSNNPLLHRAYQPMNSNMQRKYSNSKQPSTPGAAPTTPGTPSTPAVLDATTVVSPQSKSMNTTINSYPP